MTEYRVTYWNVRGRGEPIRMILAAANIPFEDNRISKDSWSTLRPNTPWGQVPILEFDGQVLVQSMTICRYLAKKFDLSGRNEWEAAKCDEYVDVTSDLLEEMKKIIHAPNEETKAERKSQFMSHSLPNFLAKFEQILSKQKGSFLVGDHLSWADIVLQCMLEKLETNYGGQELLDKYPNLKIMKIAVQEYPGIMEWMQRRPKE